MRYILEMYGHFSGINRKVQLKYQAKGKSKSSSSGSTPEEESNKDPSLLLILKWGGELTPTGRVQASNYHHFYIWIFLLYLVEKNKVIL